MVGAEKFPAGQVTLHPVEHDPFAPPGLEHFDPDQPETAAAPTAQAPPKKPFSKAPRLKSCMVAQPSSREHEHARCRAQQRSKHR